MDKFPDLTPNQIYQIVSDDWFKAMMTMPSCPICNGYSFSVLDADDKRKFVEFKCSHCENILLGSTSASGQIVFKKWTNKNNWIKKLIRIFKRG